MKSFWSEMAVDLPQLIVDLCVVEKKNDGNPYMGEIFFEEQLVKVGWL